MNNEHLDTIILEAYLDGKLDAKAMHFVERMALEDPFVGEALEGLKQAPHRRQTLSLLQKQLKERVEQMPAKRKLWGIVTHRLSIAATAAILFVSASVIFWLQEANKRKGQEMAGKKVEIKLTPLAGDSLESVKEEIITKPAIDQVIAAAKPERSGRKPTAPATVQDVVKAAPAVAAAPTAAARSMQSSMVVPPAAEGMKQTESFAPAAKVAGINPVPSQAGMIKGTVFGENGQPLIGAGVYINDVKTYLSTDSKGYFEFILDSAKLSEKLKIYHLGYETKEVLARVNDPLKIVLSADNKAREATIAAKNRENAERAAAAKTALRFFTGTVVDKDGKPLAGAGVVNKDKTEVFTDAAGKFKLAAQGTSEETITVRLKGYKTEQVKVTAGTPASIVLKQ